MAYNKQTFSPGQTLMAEDLNKMSEGIVNKLEFVDVETLPTENVDENSVYRIPKLNDLDIYSYIDDDTEGSYILINMKDAPNLMGATSIKIVDELPETGPDFMSGVTFGSLFVYYDISQDDVYVFSGEYSYELSGGMLPINEWITFEEAFTVLGEPMEVIFVDSMQDIPAYDGTSTIYAVRVYFDKYYVYKDGKWIELVTSDTAKEYIPEKHLYEWSVSIIGSHDNGNHTNFQFNYITDETPVGSVNEKGLYDAKKILDQIGRKTTNYIVQEYYFTACGEYNNTTNGDSIVQYFIIKCLDIGSYNYSVRVIKSNANTNYYIDATTLAAMSAYVACRQIF